MANTHSGMSVPLIFLLLTLLSFTTKVIGSPFSIPSPRGNASHPVQLCSLIPLPRTRVWKRDDKTIELRILPLGASITWGTNSKSGNGYRKYLRDQLWVDGWSVDMVGTKNHGNMQDNAVEAHPGDVITQIQTAAQKSLPYRPNVVLINAGANDCKLRLDIPKAGARMRAMIEDIVHYDGMEKTTIILSTLIPSSDPQTAVSIPTVNAQYRELVTTMRKEGMSIVLAEMNPPSSVVAHNLLSWPRDYTTNGKADITHPNDCGYRKMARVWYDAIGDAYDENLIVKAGVMAASESCEDGSCNRVGVLYARKN